MYSRSKFITNSSSTSLVAFGVKLDIEDIGKLLDLIDFLPEDIDYKIGEVDTVYFHIGFPEIDLDEDGLLFLPAVDSMQKKYNTLKQWLKTNDIDAQIGYIEEGWYNG